MSNDAITGKAKALPSTAFLTKLRRERATFFQQFVFDLRCHR